MRARTQMERTPSRRFPHRALVAVLLLGPLGAAALGEGRGAADEPTPEAIAEAAQLFRSSCATCHLPPDPARETDRAWLDQVRDTA